MKLNKIILLVATFILSFGLVVNASDSSLDTRNLETMNKSNCEKLIVELIYAITSNDTDFLLNCSDLMTPSCYNDLIQYTTSNELNDILSNFVVDFTYPDNSSTGDSVIMVNTKIWDDNKEYNLAYLFEFHINSNGDIYGYNVWVY